jgi:hypothetical protein
MNKRQIIASLNNIANTLDNDGLYQESSAITNVMKRLSQDDSEKQDITELSKEKLSLQDPEFDKKNYLRSLRLNPAMQIANQATQLIEEKLTESGKIEYFTPDLFNIFIDMIEKNYDVDVYKIDESLQIIFSEAISIIRNFVMEEARLMAGRDSNAFKKIAQSYTDIIVSQLTQNMERMTGEKYNEFIQDQNPELGFGRRVDDRLENLKTTRYQR